MDLADQFEAELRVIKGAKLTFLIGFVVLAALIGYGEYSFLFKELLARKDGIIKDKSEVIDQLRQKLIDTSKANPGGSSKPIKDAGPDHRPSQGPSRVSGPVSTAGPNSPAITGDGNVVHNEVPAENPKPDAK